MKSINPLKLGGIFLILLLCNSAFADTAQMNATLARISAVLNQINPLINLAQSQQNPNARVQFQLINYEVISQIFSLVLRRQSIMYPFSHEWCSHCQETICLIYLSRNQ